MAEIKKLAGVLLVFNILSCYGDPNPEVVLSLGALSGSWETSAGGRKFASFKGIPYAKPPVGEYRFQPPLKAEPWTGTLDATQFGSACIQYDPLTPGDHITGAEDCLFLNVNTPNPNPDNLLPVIVFIHGGGFFYGSGALWGPDYLMDREVLYVTVNYRVGPLGFLSTEDDTIAGNMGLKDQSMALRWVQEHIHMFGGNPESVTLAGNSAGAVSTTLHTLSPLLKGTFHRAYASSGSALNPFAVQKNALAKAKSLANYVRCPTDSIQAMADCLKQSDAKDLALGNNQFFELTIDWFSVFTPVIEAASVKEPFINEHPYKILLSGQYEKVPVLMSTTSEEGLYPAASFQTNPDFILGALEDSWSDLAAYVFDYRDTLPVETWPYAAQEIKNHYLGGQAVGQETFGALVKALSDRLFHEGIGKMAELYAATQPTYMFYYRFRGALSVSAALSKSLTDYGVCHCDDIIHVIPFPGLGSMRPDDLQMTQNLLDMMESFAYTGVPTIPGVQWDQIVPNSGDINCLDIQGPDSMAMSTMNDFGMRKFWDSLGICENERVV